MPKRTRCLIPGVLIPAASAYSQQPAAKQVKDQREADLFNSVAGEKDPLAKLSLLNQWASSYPETDFCQERNLHYVSSYTNLEARAIAPNAPAGMVREGEKAAHIVLDRSHGFFAPDLAPGGVKQEDWAIARQEALREAHSVLATLASNRKDYTQAEAEFGKLLELARTMPQPHIGLAYPFSGSGNPLAMRRRSSILRAPSVSCRMPIKRQQSSIWIRCTPPITEI